MALDDDIRILSGVRLFEGFTQEQLRLLAFGAESMRLPAGKELYREDDDGRFGLCRGARAHRALSRARRRARRPSATAGPGAMLGELALIADTTRLTSAVAATDAEVLRLNRKLFRRILEEYPDAARSCCTERIVDDLQAMVQPASRSWRRASGRKPT